MRMEWFEHHHRMLGVLLLVLAATNGLLAYAILPKHPIMALANAVMAGVLVLGVMVFWRAGKSG